MAIRMVCCRHRFSFFMLPHNETYQRRGEQTEIVTCTDKLMWPPEYPGSCFDLHFDRFDGHLRGRKTLRKRVRHKDPRSKTSIFQDRTRSRVWVRFGSMTVKLLGGKVELLELAFKKSHVQQQKKTQHGRASCKFFSHHPTWQTLAVRGGRIHTGKLSLFSL